MSADRLLECQKFSQITYFSQERFFVKGWTSLSRSWGGRRRRRDGVNWCQNGERNISYMKIHLDQFALLLLSVLLLVLLLRAVSNNDIKMCKLCGEREREMWQLHQKFKFWKISRVQQEITCGCSRVLPSFSLSLFVTFSHLYTISTFFWSSRGVIFSVFLIYFSPLHLFHLILFILLVGYIVGRG